MKTKQEILNELRALDTERTTLLADIMKRSQPLRQALADLSRPSPPPAPATVAGKLNAPAATPAKLTTPKVAGN